jgi:hypothetical protein
MEGDVYLRYILYKKQIKNMKTEIDYNRIARFIKSSEVDVSNTSTYDYGRIYNDICCNRICDLGYENLRIKTREEFIKIEFIKTFYKNWFGFKKYYDYRKVTLDFNVDELNIIREYYIKENIQNIIREELLDKYQAILEQKENAALIEELKSI